MLLPISFLMNSAKEANLSQDQKDVFLLRFGEGRDYDSISKELKTSTGACLKRMSEVYRKFGVNTQGIKREKALRVALEDKFRILVKDNKYKDIGLTGFYFDNDIPKLTDQIEQRAKALNGIKHVKDSLYFQKLIKFNLEATLKFLGEISRNPSFTIPAERYPESLCLLQESLGDDCTIQGLATIEPNYVGEYWPHNFNKRIIDSTSEKSMRIFILRKHSFESNLFTLWKHATKYAVFLINYDSYQKISDVKVEIDFGLIEVSQNSSQSFERILVEDMKREQLYRFSVLQDADRIAKYRDVLELVKQKSTKFDLSGLDHFEPKYLEEFVYDLKQRVFS
jgi:hypothetical protein